MRLWWLVAVMAGMAVAAPANENDNAGNRELESPVKEEGLAKDEESPHHRVVRQLFDGWRADNVVADGIAALENVDEFMRSTIPNVDRFQCLERMMCSMMATDPNSSPFSGIFQGLQSLFNPDSQQGFPAQGFPQQGFPSQQPFPQQPAFQQALPQQPAFQQALPQQPAFQQPFPQQPAFQQPFPQQPAFQQPFPQQTFGPPPVGSFSQQFQPPPPQFAHAFNQVGQFRENTGAVVERRENSPVPVRRRPIRRRQRNGFLDFLRNIGLGKRKKRSIIDDIFSGFTGTHMMGMFDQMMNKYSFYPYTHAAFMGYSGDSARCETMYPTCPSTAEEMLDVFNNIHRHYPEGIPYKDRLPWPLNMLLP